MNMYGITAIQNHPSLLKEMTVSKIVDKRAHKDIGYFIAAKYEKYLKEIIEKIERDEKLDKLERLKAHQETDFCEIGIDDGVE